MDYIALRPALWTKDFVLAFISNLLLFFSFYMLIPVLPFYLMENMGATNSVAGVVLSLYTLAALIIRPFSGFLVDMFSRKPLYLICYGFFCLVFTGYVVATTLTFFIFLRIMHGFAFGTSTVSGSTVAVDIMPSSRRGEGIGYYGMTASIAMAAGPLAGVWIQKNHSFDMLFIAAFVSSLIGWLSITLLKPVKKEISVPETKPPLSLDRFILTRALPCVALLFICGMGYGSVLNYVGLYSETKMPAYESSAGVFFMFVSAGIIIARMASAKAINQGKIVRMIYIGTSLLVLSFALFTISNNAITLYITALLLGAGCGYINPSFQTMFINLGEHNQRGTANATYFTFWDFGIGFGTLIGGVVIEYLNFEWLYGISSVLLILGAVYFAIVSGPWFERNKLR